MRIEYTQPAPEGGRFAPGALDAQIGKTVPVRLGSATREAVVRAVTVADDGRSALVELDVVGTVPGLQPGLGAFGFIKD